ncbi:VOC family protein [Roseiterribacter gracilis]|uniref:Polyphosphate kinase n=1 Tax=Roseiterribacter gracilis TaxID=2812848 RepID=A0A8S8X8K3_9PROT|nr:polyphosphate kinase [Rhodospirillales bacterium TMPK1]
MVELDHITVAAATLDEAARYVEERLGIDSGPGGAHARMGTHNRLLRLGPALFLEMIAPDPDNPTPPQHWFGLGDAINLSSLQRNGPRLATWVVRTGDIALGARSPIALGPAARVARGNLEWSITVPEDGSMPADGAMPTLIQWPDGPHPASRMHDAGATLVGLQVRSPEDVAGACAAIGFHDPRVTFETGALQLTAKIATPHGVRTLF